VGDREHGLAVGAGYYTLTTLIFLTMLVIQFPLRWLENVIEERLSSAQEARTQRQESRRIPERGRVGRRVPP